MSLIKEEGTERLHFHLLTGAPDGGNERVHVLVCSPYVSFPFAESVSQHSSPSFSLPRSRVWFFQDVTRTDLPQLRLRAERRDSAVLVPVQQLRIQLQLQPHSMTHREPLLARETVCPGPACGGIAPSASWKTNCSRS